MSTPERWGLSAASTLVLRDGGAPAGEMLKLAIKDLVLAGTWRIEAGERNRRLRGPTAATVLVRGDSPPPGRVPLGLAHSLIASGPVERHGPVEGREIRALAKHIARTRRRLGSDLINRVSVDLANKGLVEWVPRRRLGIFRTAKMVPTAVGERLLAESRQHEEALAALPREPGAAERAAGVVAAAGGLLLLFQPADRQWAGIDAAVGVDALGGLGGFDALDALGDAFDAGFSDGGGGGDAGGGDAGGGDGGGGGGGGDGGGGG
jgi:uncharacterized membrane protein YgcG